MGVSVEGGAACANYACTKWNQRDLMGRERAIPPIPAPAARRTGERSRSVRALDAPIVPRRIPLVPQALPVSQALITVAIVLRRETAWKLFPVFMAWGRNRRFGGRTRRSAVNIRAALRISWSSPKEEPTGGDLGRCDYSIALPAATFR